MMYVELPYIADICINVNGFVHETAQLYLLSSTIITRLFQNVCISYYYMLYILFHYKILNQFWLFHSGNMSLNIHGVENYNTQWNVPLIISDTHNLIQIINANISLTYQSQLLIKYLISPLPSTEISQSLRPQICCIRQTYILQS